MAVSGMAVFFGICSAIAILAFQEGIKHGPIATSWLIINLSSGVPTLGSIFIYHEVVNFRKASALILVAVSMFLLWKDKKAAELNSRLAPLNQAGLGLGEPAWEDPGERK
jgi:drug/metabolite transporter (DMT)-like permease